MLKSVVCFCVIFFLLVCSVFVSFAVLITEIDFTDTEFVEFVFTNDSAEFNETYFYVFDESENRNNTFSSVYIHPNSSIFLIVGSDFLDEYTNYELLNCSIYETSGSQVGYGGMSFRGENFSVQFNEDMFVNFSSLDEYYFGDNYTLQLVNNSNASDISSISNYDLSNRSICELSSYQKSLAKDVRVAVLQNNSDNLSSLVSNCNLGIIVDEVVEDSKIFFSFDGNISYGVEYYVEDGVGNVVKSKLTSTTSTSKSYTPKKNGKFVVYGEIKDLSCEAQVSKDVYFYNDELDEDNEDSSIIVERDTFIGIDSVLLKGIHEVILSGEISRGDSSKYKLKVLVDGEEVSEFSVKKYGRFDFEFPLYLKPGEHDIVIEGFGKRDEVTIEMPNVVLEIEDELIVLLENKGIEFNSENFLEQKLQLPELNSSELELAVRTIMTNVSENNLLLTKLQANVSQEDSFKENTLRSVFSKHIIDQNIGLGVMILGLILLCLVIVLRR